MNRIIIVATLAILTILSAGCIDNDIVNTEPEVRYVYVTPTPTQSPEYTEIWMYMVMTAQYFSDDHVLLNSVAEPVEMTSPYTEYLWTDNGESMLPEIEKMFAGTGYTRMYTNEETGEYVTDDTYTYQAEFEVDYPIDMGYVLIYIDVTAVRS